MYCRLDWLVGLGLFQWAAISAMLLVGLFWGAHFSCITALPRALVGVLILDVNSYAYTLSTLSVSSTNSGWSWCVWCDGHDLYSWFVWFFGHLSTTVTTVLGRCVAVTIQKGWIQMLPLRPATCCLLTLATAKGVSRLGNKKLGWKYKRLGKTYLCVCVWTTTTSPLRAEGCPWEGWVCIYN